MLDLDRLDFERGTGLVTVVVQSEITGQVLMLAHADRDAIQRTMETGDLHLFSRTRGPWLKGETSGNRQRVRSLTPDCDGDAVLALVRPAGPACHTGATSCFGAPGGALASLSELIASRAEDLKGEGHTRRLLADRNLRLKKLGEEAAELAVACADGDRPRAISEAADLIYHTLVALRGVGARLEDVEAELAARAAP